MKTESYLVKGSGRFPIDMLRYDAAWPSREEDSRMIALPDGGSRYVQLTSIRAPTAARWESFGWTVDLARETR